MLVILAGQDERVNRPPSLDRRAESAGKGDGIVFRRRARLS
jgi:hypothetical protein